MHMNTKNPLLVRNDLGRARPPTHDLPPSDHSYGLKYKARTEGVKDILHRPSSHKPPKLASMPKNFAKINIEAQTKHFAKRGEYIEFTKGKDIRIKRKLGSTEVDNLLPSEDFAYGLHTKPSESMKNIMGKINRERLRYRS